MAVDLSGLTFLVPIFGFLFVFIILFALLSKTKILGGSRWIDLFVSFIVSIIFVSVSSARVYVESILPWFAILIVAIFLVLIIIGITQKDLDKFMKPWFAWVFIILLIIIFLVAAIKVFAPSISPWLPGYSSAGLDPLSVRIKDFFYSSKFLGSLLLIILAAIVSWVLVKAK